VSTGAASIDTRAVSTLDQPRSSPPPLDQHAVWDKLWDEAAFHFKTQKWKTGDLAEFGIDRFLHNEVLSHKSLACALAQSVGGKLQANQATETVNYKAVCRSAFDADPEICEAVAADLQVHCTRAAAPRPILAHDTCPAA
jgi:hypothetical protein